jgi:toxin ParE1/3/4
LKALLPNVTPGMANVELSSEARADLANIDDYSAEQFGQDVADAYTRGFNEAFSLLRRHPLAGEAKPDLGRDIRCIVHRKHRIFIAMMAIRC